MMECNLVLSGGGVRGYAHVGAIRALKEKGVTVSAISGTSSGAMIGAFFCDGFELEEIEEILLKQKPKLGINVLNLRQSILSFSTITGILKKNLRSKKIEHLRLPLHVALTSLETGLQVVVNEGDLVETLTAASALPVFLPSVVINGVAYADGGMSNNLPVEPFLSSDKKLIGIHVNPVQGYKSTMGLRQTIDRSMHIIVRNNILENIKKCDVFIEPSGLVDYHIFELNKIEDIIREGYHYTKEHVKL